ncbi:pyocin knob domain-containing protein [Achromobacter dolens]|uniref:pyocin knob domain-containing protein n=1 Tax=Achromobacter dolens TaxID=1287738 RepID=UPI003B9A2486
MATLQAINVGKTDNDQAGDPLRVAMQKVNANFADVQSGLAGLWNASTLGATVDLNTLTNPGRYHQGANANALTGSNYPIANAGLLEVAASADGLFVYQEYTQYRSGAYSRRFWRSFYGGIWAAWQELPALSQKGAANGLATLDANGKVPVAQIPSAFAAVLPTTAHDLNDYATPGSFYQSAIAGATAGANYPVANVGFLEVTATGTPVAQVYTTRTNVAAAMQRFWRVRVSATAWSAWKELTDVSTVVSYAGSMAAAQDLNSYTQRGPVGRRLVGDRGRGAAIFRSDSRATCWSCLPRPRAAPALPPGCARCITPAMATRYITVR